MRRTSPWERTRVDVGSEKSREIRVNEQMPAVVAQGRVGHGDADADANAALVVLERDRLAHVLDDAVCLCGELLFVGRFGDGDDEFVAAQTCDHIA